MKIHPIKIPDDIGAKYDQLGQFEAFDQAFRKVITLPAAKVAAIIELTRHKSQTTTKGRPKKT